MVVTLDNYDLQYHKTYQGNQAMPLDLNYTKYVRSWFEEKPDINLLMMTPHKEYRHAFIHAYILFYFS